MATTDPDEMMQAHRLTPDGSLFSPATLQEVRDRLEYIDAHECDCGETPHEDALHDLAHDDVPALLQVIEQLAPRRVETAAELDALRVGTVIRSDAGTIACRSGLDHGVVFGDERQFRWRLLALPAIVLWEPTA
ncbi:hypothetical protein [Mycolicibacterium nivoides]|uniref:DUF4440 domain-containing protein n=1 Tax=Mycolicibacterium nivoides TaxID=2487344 RepID=A0ABW9L8D2_9MYCO